MPIFTYRTKPDFLIIDTQKCGTSSLFYYLSQHPELNMPQKRKSIFLTYIMLKEQVGIIAYF
jgi:hypothetical protein